MNDINYSIVAQEMSARLDEKFLDASVSLDVWIAEVKKCTDKRNKSGISEKFRLSDMLGDGYSYLCGRRDLSDLFACSKKEENTKANIWQKAFGEAEWQAYQLARMEYYLEINCEKMWCEEDVALLGCITKPGFLKNPGQDCWKLSLGGLYLLCRQQAMKRDENRERQILELRDALLAVDDEVCRRNVKALTNLYFAQAGDVKSLTEWIAGLPEKDSLTLAEQLCQIKGRILLQQYDRLEVTLLKLMLYLLKYNLKYFYAEALFQMAVLYQHYGQTKEALCYGAESFSISKERRYVNIYLDYGIYGMEVVSAYMNWMQENGFVNRELETVYKYGHVLRMSFENYLQLVLRKTKRGSSKEKNQQKRNGSNALTQMEVKILQDISKGMSNADICKDKDLKLPTVKTHLYNAYKKLDVSNRVQAILRAKELGIIN